MKKQSLITYHIISLLALIAYYIFFSFDAIKTSVGASGDGQMYIFLAFFIIFLPTIITNVACLATTLLSTKKRTIIISYFVAVFTPISGIWLLHYGFYHHYFHLEIGLIFHVIAFIGYILLYKHLIDKPTSESTSTISKDKNLIFKKILSSTILIIVCHVFYAQIIEAFTSILNICNDNVSFHNNIIEFSAQQHHIWCLICVLLSILFVYKNYTKLVLGTFIFSLMPNIHFLYKCIRAITSADGDFKLIRYNYTLIHLESNYINKITNYLYLTIAVCVITILVYVVMQRYINKKIKNINIFTLIIDTLYVLLSYNIVNIHFDNSNIFQCVSFIILISLLFLSNKTSLIKTIVYATLLYICWFYVLISKGNFIAQDMYFLAYSTPCIASYYAIDYWSRKFQNTKQN